MLSRFSRITLARRSTFLMAAQPQRMYLHDLGLDANALVQRQADGVGAAEVDLWREQQQ